MCNNLGYNSNSVIYKTRTIKMKDTDKLKRMRDAIRIAELAFLITEQFGFSKKPNGSYYELYFIISQIKEELSKDDPDEAIILTWIKKAEKVKNY